MSKLPVINPIEIPRHFKLITTISGELPVRIGGPHVPTPLVV
jgi:hypothetical protein